MPPKLKGLRIFVVEDNFLVAEMICDLLEDCGCEVVGPVGRLDKALGMVSSATLDGALLDINLAGEFCLASTNTAEWTSTIDSASILQNAFGTFRIAPNTSGLALS